MTEHVPAKLITELEQRTLRLVDGLDAARRQATASQAQVARLEQHGQTLSDALTSLKAREAERLAHQEQLERKIESLEGQCHELQEECRGLSEHNKEVEQHNQDLQKRLESSGPPSSQPHPVRQSKGLSALMGQSSSARQSPIAGSASSAEPVTESSPVAMTPVRAQPSPEPVAKTCPTTPTAPSPQALLKEWYQRYDSAFFKGHTQPLKVGIHEDLAAAEPWPEKLVRRALACYVNLPRYLKAVRHGAPRIDLEGQPSGCVDEGAADHARRKLEHLQAERRSNRKATRATGKKASRSGPHERRAASAQNVSNTKSPTGAEHSQGRSHHHEGTPRRDNAALPEDPSKRMQHKLDALMARHGRQ